MRRADGERLHVGGDLDGCGPHRVRTVTDLRVTIVTHRQQVTVHLHILAGQVPGAHTRHLARDEFGAQAPDTRRPAETVTQLPLTVVAHGVEAAIGQHIQRVGVARRDRHRHRVFDPRGSKPVGRRAIA